MLLRCEAEGNVDAWIHRVAEVVHAINLDDKDVLRAKPVARDKCTGSPHYENVPELLEHLRVQAVRGIL
jgi:hypothetical protein